MNNFKFHNFIKNILLILLVFLIITIPLTALARPGGGGGGTGGGGGHAGGGGRSSSSHTGSPGTNSTVKSNPILDIIDFALFACIASAGAIIVKVKLGKKKIESISAINELAKNDNNWNYDDIKKDIKDTFYKIGVAWMERDQDLAKEYMSEELYDRHKTKTEWMKVRKEKNILENMTLLRSTPIGLKDCEGTDKDSLWVHIKAKSIDYTINEETNEVVEGQSYKCVYYQEYWKFIKKDDRWVLDEIRQTDDIDDLNFFAIEIDNKNN